MAEHETVVRMMRAIAATLADDPAAQCSAVIESAIRAQDALKLFDAHTLEEPGDAAQSHWYLEGADGWRYQIGEARRTFLIPVNCDPPIFEQRRGDRCLAAYAYRPVVFGPETRVAVCSTQ